MSNSAKVLKDIFFTCGFKSEKGVSSSEMSLLGSSSAEGSGISSHAHDWEPKSKYICSSKIFTRIGWSYFKLDTACRDEKESECLKAKRTGQVPLCIQNFHQEAGKSMVCEYV